MARQDKEAQSFVADVIVNEDKFRPQWIYEHIDDPNHAEFLTRLLFSKMGVPENIPHEKELKDAIQR